MTGVSSTGASGRPEPKTPDAEASARSHSIVVKSALRAALNRSLSQALKSAGVIVPQPKGQELVDKVSQEVTLEFEQTTSAVFQGPMPPPVILQGYENVVPGLASQIAEMAAKEQHHRHQWERRALWNDILAQSGGLWLGWVLAAGCACGAFYLADKGNNLGAGILLSVVVVSLVRSFTSGGSKGAEATSDKPQGTQYGRQLKAQKGRSR